MINYETLSSNPIYELAFICIASTNIIESSNITIWIRIVIFISIWNNSRMGTPDTALVSKQGYY